MTVARRQYIDTDEDYWANATTGIHNVLDYHAAGNGVTDDTAALQEAADAAAAADETLYIPDGDYVISDTLTIKGHCRVGPAAELQYTGSGTALELSDTAAILFKEIHLPRVVKVTEDHAGTNIGVHIKGVNSCQIWVPYIRDFARGLVISGAPITNGNANYLTVYVGSLVDNKINLDFDPDTGCSTNQNTFLAGRCYHGTNHIGPGGETTRVPGYYHIRLNNADTWDPGNNTFIGTSLEGATAEYTIVCYGSRNLFLNCRFENAPYIFWGANSTANQVLFGTGSENLKQTYEAGSISTNHGYNTVMTPHWMQLEGHRDPVIRLMQRTAAKNTLALYSTVTGGLSALSDAQLTTDWLMLLATDAMKFKLAADAAARMQITYADGSIRFGDGTTLDAALLKQIASGYYGVSGGSIGCTGAYNTPLRVGNYRLWLSSGGLLRGKNGAPSDSLDGMAMTTTHLREWSSGVLYDNSTPLVPAERTTAVATIYAVGNVFSGFIHVMTRANRTAAIYSVAVSQGSIAVTLVSKEPAAAAWDALPVITWSSGDAIHTLSMTLNDQFTASPVVVAFAQLYGEDLALTWLL